MEQQIQAKADDKTLAGRYTNFAQIAHTKDEFVIDYFNLLPPTGILVSRVINSPANFKRLVKAMGENLKNYEDQFGMIKEPDNNVTHKIGFKTD